MCMYVCMYVCMCVRECVCVCMYVCMCVCVCVKSKAGELGSKHAGLGGRYFSGCMGVHARM